MELSCKVLYRFGLCRLTFFISFPKHKAETMAWMEGSDVNIVWWPRFHISIKQIAKLCTMCYFSATNMWLIQDPHVRKKPSLFTTSQQNASFESTIRIETSLFKVQLFHYRTGFSLKYKFSINHNSKPSNNDQ